MEYGDGFFYGVVQWIENVTGGGGGQGNVFVTWCGENEIGLVCMTFCFGPYGHGLVPGRGRDIGAGDGHGRLCLVSGPGPRHGHGHGHGHGRGRGHDHGPFDRPLLRCGFRVCMKKKGASFGGFEGLMDEGCLIEFTFRGKSVICSKLRGRERKFRISYISISHPSSTSTLEPTTTDVRRHHLEWVSLFEV